MNPFPRPPPSSPVPLTMAALSLQGVRIVQVLVASTVVLILFLTVSHYGADSLKNSGIADHVPNVVPDKLSKPSLPFTSEAPPEPQPANETLNFQEIIYVSMPYRTDRQDALSLIAAVTGLKLTMIPGV